MFQIKESGEGEEQCGSWEHDRADGLTGLTPVGGDQKEHTDEGGECDGQLEDVRGGSLVVLRRLEVAGGDGEQSDEGEDQENFGAEAMKSDGLHERAPCDSLAAVQ